MDESNPEAVQWANATDLFAFYQKAKTPFSDLIVKCKVGFGEVPCPEPRSSITRAFGFCYTMLGTADTAYTISEPGFSSAFSLEIDIHQHEYGNTWGPGAGIWVNIRFIYMPIAIQMCFGIMRIAMCE